MKILVCNAGSTSLKFKLFQMPGEEVMASGKVERVGSRDAAIFHYSNPSCGHETKLDGQDIPTYAEGIQLFLSYLLDRDTGALGNIEELERIGFKTVLAKGFLGIHELTDEVLEAMETYLVVAPAHNGPYLEAIRQFKEIVPSTRLIGAFETAFHQTIPLERRLYGIPYEWYEQYGIQRFGYHGASHSYVAETIAQQEGATGRLISCHLGGSGSLCAILDGKSQDNSFGFSLQTGILHANRIGDTDAYIIPYLLSEGMNMEDILHGMDKRGGMLALSGLSNDMRDIEEAMDTNPRAKLAIDALANGIVKYIGAYYAELGGLDHLVFTGGIGEHSPILRAAVCRQIGHLGVQLDERRNQNRPDRTGQWLLSTPTSPVKVQIIPANEELGVARKTYAYQL